MNIASRVAQQFREAFRALPEGVARAPGRVNLLGEHVDYNDGFVLPAAIDRATYAAFGSAHAAHSDLLALDFGERAAFQPDTLSNKTQPDGFPLPGWALYPAGVAWSLTGHGEGVKPIQAAFASDVPRGAGLSSSASVELAFAVAWMRLGGWSLPPMELAVLSQRAENQYVGVRCGIMDQFASACGERNRLLLLDCRSLQYRTLPLPENVDIIIADTTIRHSHVSGEYNNRRAACEEAVRLLQQQLPDIRSLRDVSLKDFNRLSTSLPPVVEKRARHVVEEIVRTLSAVELLEAGDLQGFGLAMNACHESLRDLYEVSCPEADVMVSIAQGLEGCYGARITGGGFGGCTVNLVQSQASAAFVQRLGSEYEAQTGLQPEIYTCQASAGAGIL